MIELSSSNVNANNDVHKNSGGFFRITEKIGYNDFFRDYMEVNMPCIFSSWLTQDWTARKNWVTSDSNPDMDYYLVNYGKNINTDKCTQGLAISVINCQTQSVFIECVNF